MYLLIRKGFWASHTSHFTSLVGESLLQTGMTENKITESAEVIRGCNIIQGTGGI